MATLIGKPESNPLSVLNNHLDAITTELKEMRTSAYDHHYMLIEGEPSPESTDFLIACFGCSKQAEKMVYPCTRQPAGLVVPPPGISVPVDQPDTSN